MECVDDAPEEAPVGKSPQVHLLSRKVLDQDGVSADQRPNIGACELGKKIPNAFADANLVCGQRLLGFFENHLQKCHPAVLLGRQPYVTCKSIQNSGYLQRSVR